MNSQKSNVINLYNSNDRKKMSNPADEDQAPGADKDKRQDPGVDECDELEAPAKGNPNKAPIKEPPKRR